MHRQYSFHSLLDNERSSWIQKYKMRTLLCLLSITACSLVMFSITTAVPIDDYSSTTTVGPQSTSTEDLKLSSTTISSTPTDDSGSSSEEDSIVTNPPVGYINGSKLVITNVVKTLQFEVGIEEDDGNDTVPASTPFIETDLEVLNPELLAEVVSELNTSSIDGTKNVQHEEDAS